MTGPARPTRPPWSGGPPRHNQQFDRWRVDLNNQDKDGLTPLHYASRKGFAEVVQALLEAGADPSVPENYGFTPLHEAAENGRREVAQLLLGAGADRGAALRKTFSHFKAGFTPADVARAAGKKGLVKLLEP